jgi:hypothetical protein
VRFGQVATATFETSTRPFNLVLRVSLYHFFLYHLSLCYIVTNIHHYHSPPPLEFLFHSRGISIIEPASLSWACQTFSIHEDPRINNRCNGYVIVEWVAICEVTLLPRPRTFGFAGVAGRLESLGPLMKISIK